MKPTANVTARVLFMVALGVFEWVSVPRTACAQSSEAQSEGRALFQEGIDLLARGKYPEACSKLEASLTRLPGIGTRGKLAECYEKLGRTGSAWTLYREVALLAARAGQPEREQAALVRAKVLEERLSRVIIVPKGIVDSSDSVIKLAGKVVPSEELGSPVVVDPGDIRIEASAPGRQSWSTTIHAAEASSVRVDVPVLESIAITDGPKRPQGSDWQRTGGLVAGGIGVASILVGGYFGLSAKSTYDGAFESDCRESDNSCNSAGKDSVDRAYGKAVASTVFVGAGIVLVATGAALFFTAPKRVSSGSLQLVPSVGPGNGGIMLTGKL